MSADAHEAEYRQRLQAALGLDFELRDLIGRGGFGVVYGAWDKKLEREVAVKALRHDLFPTPVVLERFQREAKSLAQLRHAHVLPVYEVGTGQGIAFMVMPFIKGETLGDILDRGERVSATEAIRITVEIARALDAAHRAGIVHRDVKPDNILIEGPDRHAVLSDFGIAKAAGGADLTGAGVAIGSPQYMSPEQAAAERDVDARSDIYSLGAVAYEMLAGRRVYEADSLQRLLVLQATTDPPSLASVAPGTPSPVVEAVMRALARDPVDRWQSAGDFGGAISTGSSNADRSEPESWFARRGLQLAGLNFVGATLIGVSSAVFSQTKSGAVRVTTDIFAKPLAVVIGVVMIASIAELIVTMWLAARRRREHRALAALRAGFGQPRWWQPWYPRFLRHPDNAWDVIPFSMKALRTMLWLEMVTIPFVFPMIFVFPSLNRMVAEAGTTLPLPARVAFGFTSALELPLQLGFFAIPLGALAVAWLRKVPAMAVFALLVTWRRDAWNSPAGHRLRRHDHDAENARSR